MHAGTAGDYRALARRRLPRMIFDYIDGAAGDEVTMARNLQAFAEVKLRQRVLRDCTGLNQSTTLFGQAMSMPLLMAPIGGAGLYARRGEVQAARAAEAAGIPFCLSTASVCPLEEVAKAVSAPPWFQLYMIKDRGRLDELLARARELGAPPLIFTVDMPVPGLRYRDVRSGFAGEPSRMRSLKQLVDGATHPAWVADVYMNGRPLNFGNFQGFADDGQSLASYFAWVAGNFDPSTSWKDLEWVRERWPGPIVLKGVMDPADADQAMAAGIEGVIVSNHGGRQLDGVAGSLTLLSRVVERVAGRGKVLVDGGVRSGGDILKALALGADACLIGRAWAYALAAEGERGVARVLANLQRELTVAMALSGCRDVADAGPELIDPG